MATEMGNAVRCMTAREYRAEIRYTIRSIRRLRAAFLAGGDEQNVNNEVWYQWQMQMAREMRLRNELLERHGEMFTK